MAGAAGLGRSDRRALGGALLVSLVLHVAVLVGLPALDPRQPAAPKSLQAKIVIEEAEEPAPPIPPARPAAAPPTKAASPVKPAPSPKPAPAPRPVAPREASAPPPVAAAEVAPSPAPQADPSQPSESEKPVPPAPIPPAPALPPKDSAAGAAKAREAEAVQTLAQYRLQLIGAAGRYKRYPALARENHWTGTVVVGVVLEPGGRARVSVRRSSGHAILDEQAVDMFERALRAVPVPAGLRGGAHAFEVRAIYGLEE